MPLPMQSDGDACREMPKCGGRSNGERGEDLGRAAHGRGYNGKEQGDRYGRANHHHVESEDTWSRAARFSHSLVYTTRSDCGYPPGDERIMLVLGFSFMVVLYTSGRCISVGVRWPEMRKEHKRRGSTSRMVNKDMRRGEERQE